MKKNLHNHTIEYVKLEKKFFVQLPTSYNKLQSLKSIKEENATMARILFQANFQFFV